MCYPRNKAEWWELVNNNWPDLKQIVLNYYPCQKSFPKKGWNIKQKTTLLAPQAACNKVVQKLRTEKPVWQNAKSFEEYIEKLKNAEDSELAEIFNSAWFGIPESRESRSLPSFFLFCDLCSETYVLYER